MFFQGKMIIILFLIMLSHQILIILCSIAQEDEPLNFENANMSGDTESPSVTMKVVVWVSADEESVWG